MIRALLVATLLIATGCSAPQETRPLPPGAASFGDRKPVDFNGRGPHRYPVHGIDVARFQSDIDWQRARRAGVNFAFIKATEGGDMLDPQFDSHWHGAGRAGVHRGAYHFFYFCTSAADQARWFIRNVPRTRGSLPPVLDLEWNPFSPTCASYRPSAEVVRREAKIFLDMLERYYKQRPIIYTTPQFYEDNDLGRMRGEEFWLRSTAKTLREAYPGQRWSFWQYTATGIVPGAKGDIDLNVFSGSPSDWDAWLVRRRL